MRCEIEGFRIGFMTKKGLVVLDGVLLQDITGIQEQLQFEED